MSEARNVNNLINLVTHSVRHQPGDVEQFFEKYFDEVLEFGQKLPHHPLLVLSAEQAADADDAPLPTVVVTVIREPVEILSFPSTAIVLVQWPGKWRSDFFAIPASEFQERLNVLIGAKLARPKA